MAEIITYNRVILKLQSPWNIGSETTHDWSVKFNLSGAAALSSTDAEATAHALAGPILALTESATSLIEYVYYAPGSKVATSFNTYAPGTYPGTGSAYNPASGQAAQLEVAILLRSPVGKNSLGKPVYLRKWVHGVLASSTDPNSHASLADPSGLLSVYDDGAGPSKLVPVAPRNGSQGGPWMIEGHLYTHQLRRGHKRKAAVGASALDQVLKAVGTGIAAKAVLEEALALLG
jgi:hypothetical protein